MGLTSEQRIKLLEMVYGVGDWTEAWLSGLEDLMEIFPDEPWLVDVEGLAQGEYAYDWTAVLERYGTRNA